MDANQLVEAIKEIADTKGLSDEAVVAALESAISKAYIKVLGGWEDAVIKCVVDTTSGQIYLAQVKTVRDEVTDDYLEIETEEANEGLKKAKYKDGDLYEVVANVEDLSKSTAFAVKSYLRAALNEAERTELYKLYKDHIGEMVTGTVEKADDRSILVNIGRATVELGRKELIGDEFFKVGDPVKVYIEEVKTAEETTAAGVVKKKGPQIQATRASEGFLKRLFEEEIREVYDGTVLIKGISRQAGVRSKVAVASSNPDVDPTGACIGQGGSRIQKIVGQLGNGRVKEKIDIIQWSPYTPKFIMESVRPILASGIYVDEENKAAKVVLTKEAYQNQLGRYRSNLSLAGKLTGYHVEVIDEERAASEGLAWETMEQAEASEEKMKAELEAEETRRRLAEEAAKRAALEAARKAAEEAAKKAAEEAQRAAEEAKRRQELASRGIEALPENPVAPKASANPELFPSEALNPAAAALAAMAAAKEAQRAAEEAQRAAEEAASAVESLDAQASAEPEPTTTEVKTTTTLSDLEAELSSSRKAPAKPAKGKRPHRIGEDEVKHETAPKAPAAPTTEGMAIYTEEELKQIEEEEAQSSFEEPLEGEDEDFEDYDEYDEEDGK